MLLLSWNVAGLSTTLHKIDADFSSASFLADPHVAPSKRSRSHAFSHYLGRLHGRLPDILCIQEHKIPLKLLSSRGEPFGCAHVDGYDSFWSCCTDIEKRGFNGVVTYARKGCVVSADSRPLGEKDLDDQGRCIFTDHGSFVVFNVYVPLGGTGSVGGKECGLAHKMRFLVALRRAMQKRREKGKKVILVGDLNIAHGLMDRHWTFRTVCVDRVIRQVQEAAMQADAFRRATNVDTMPEWKFQLERNWKDIAKALSTIEAVSTKTTNIANGRTFDKYRARVTLNPERKIYLGSNEASDEDCLVCFNFAESRYKMAKRHDGEGKHEEEEIIAREANVVPLLTLAELMKKIARVEWDAQTLRQISESADSLNRRSPTIDWLNELFEKQDMMDPFRHVYPHAKHRFTCWMQTTNRRYENMGSRIDYTLVETSISHYIDKDDAPKLRSCFYEGEDFDSEDAAHHAATASGNFVGAPLGGGGIGSASAKAMETQFGDGASTGILYTAPQYSDHVAISLVLNAGFDAEFYSTSLSLDAKDAATKKAQPHRAQKSISSFFGASSVASSSNKRKNDGNPKLSSISKKSKSTLFDHFGASSSHTPSKATSKAPSKAPSKPPSKTSSKTLQKSYFIAASKAKKKP